MSAKVKLALVGCGWISGNHVKGYRDLQERGCQSFEVVACVDPNQANADRQADEIAAFQKNRPAVLASIQDLLAAKLADAADVCTPHAFHHTAAVECLNGGLHVMLEKPLGLTLRAGEKIIEAAQKNRRILSTGEDIRRFQTARACAWALTERKIIGDVRNVDVVWRCNQPLDLADPKWKWRAVKRLTGGGMILDSGAHLADMMLVLFGNPQTVYCTMRTVNPAPIQDVPFLGEANVDVEDEWHAVITFPGGVRLTWTFSRYCPGEETRYGKYYGENGVMTDLGFVFHPFQGGGEAKLADGTMISSERIVQEYMNSLSAGRKDRLFPYGATDGFAIEVADFVRAIAEGDSVEMDGPTGQAAKALSLACYESATTGGCVSYDDVRNGAIRRYQAPIDEYWKL
ncbi:MAG: Gfo/Idh/MocA family oxidoreductase [Phycisphaerae bacterium]|nr:Gfo/Idh/MocA family oxidoreductase [Phycisphaerae bacterium]